MKNRKHYVVKENEFKDVKKFVSNWDNYIVIPESEKQVKGKYYSSFDTKEEAQETADRFNSTYYTSDYSEDEIKEFFDSIDFDVIKKAVNDYMGLDCELTFKLDKYRGEYRIRVDSVDLTKVVPAYSKMFYELKIKDFGTSIKADEKTGELYAWIDLNFQYEHFGYGSNGCTLTTVFYKKSNNGLSIKFEKDRDAEIRAKEF